MLNNAGGIQKGKTRTVEWRNIWQALLPSLMLLVNNAEVSHEKRFFGIMLLSTDEVRSVHDFVAEMDVGMAVKERWQ